MHAIVIHRPGGYARLRFEARPSAPPPAGFVAVRTAAVGVNYADCLVRMGLYQSARDYVGWPITPGFEVAGTVLDRGEGVEDLDPGEPVIALTRFGGYATEVVVPRSQVFAVPSGFSLPQAAGFAVVNLTASYALVVLAAARRGATVLVHSAAGGVGGALCQIARHLGCHVVGVVGAPHKVAAARGRGAHAVIDRSRQDLWAEARSQSPRGFDAVFDAQGVATLAQSYRHLAPTGRLVVYGFASMIPKADERLHRWKLAWHWLRTPRFNPLDLTHRNRSVMGFNLSYLFEHHALLEEAMARLAAWADEGVLTPPELSTFALADAASAHRALETGTTVGKLVLRS